MGMASLFVLNVEGEAKCNVLIVMAKGMKIVRCVSAQEKIDV